MQDLDRSLGTAWTDGLFRGDAARLQTAWRVGGDHARADELAAFAILAALIEGEPIVIPRGAPAIGDVAPAIRIIGHAARAWRAVRDGDAAAAAEAIAALEIALAAPDADPRRDAALALADLALAECALVAGDPLVARRRLRHATRRALPTGTAIAVRLALVLRAMRGGTDAPAVGLALLDEAAALAEAAARPVDQALALTHAGMFALLSGDEPAGVARLERAIAAVPRGGPSALAVARVILASRREGDRGFEDLGEGLRVAAETGDYAAYVLLLIAASSKAVALDRPADAIAFLDNGREQLAALGPGAVRPLDDEKARLRAALGDERFTAAQRDADLARARDRADAPRDRA